MYICLPEFYVLIPYVIYWNFKLSQEVACRWQQVFGKMSNGNLEVWWSRSYYVTLCPHQFRSVAQPCPTLCDPMNYSTPGLPVHHQLPSPPKPMSIESVMPSSHLLLCCPLLLLPPIPPSLRVFSNESTLHMRWPKYWSFSFNISPSNEHPGLISFRMDWLDLLAVQGTLSSYSS